MNEDLNVTQHEYVATQNEEAANIVLFRATIRTVFKEAALGISPESFMELLKQISSGNTKVGHKLHKLWGEQCFDLLMGTLNEAITETDLNEKSKQLKEFVETSKEEGKKAWRPPGNVKEHIRSHDVQVKLKRNSELEEIVLKEEAALTTLKEELQYYRSKIVQMYAAVLSILQTFHSQYGNNEKLHESLRELKSERL